MFMRFVMTTQRTLHYTTTEQLHFVQSSSPTLPPRMTAHCPLPASTENMQSYLRYSLQLDRTKSLRVFIFGQPHRMCIALSLSLHGF